MAFVKPLVLQALVLIVKQKNKNYTLQQRRQQHQHQLQASHRRQELHSQHQLRGVRAEVSGHFFFPVLFLML
jgi:hypothetical protein